MRDIALGIIVAVMFISLIVLFCVLLGKLYIRKIKNYTRLIYQKDLDFQKAINDTILETQEQVLNNISQDLHDDAGQQLTYINFQVEHLKLDLPALHAELQPLTESVRRLSDSIRSISHSLNHQLLLQQDLMGAIEAEVKRIQKNDALAITMEVTGMVKEFSVNEKIVVYRIFQEAINNVFRHAKATAVTITIGSDPFQLEIRDNGQGFELKGTSGRQSLGISNMAQRAQIIGYSLRIDSMPGQGTSVILTDKIAS